MWQHKELFDGTYSFLDLLDAHEILDYKDANKTAYNEWLSKQK